MLRGKIRALTGTVRNKLERDRELPLGVVVRKGVTYAAGVATAPLYLRAADDVGTLVRTIGRPRIQNFGRMVIGDRVILRSVNVPVELCTEPGAVLSIGDDCSINYGASFGVTERITVGARVRIGPYVMIVDSEYHDVYARDRRPPSRPVVVEDEVWIGAKASVLPGVTIGRGAVVGTAAVVTRDVAPYTVVAGVPAVPIRALDPARFVRPSGPALARASND